MKKRLVVFALAIVLVLSAFALAACGGDTATTYSVKFMDGSKVLKEEKVEEGGKLESYSPSKDGYEFMGWYSTPSFNHKYDFTAKITKDTIVYAGFSLYKVDTREFNILGSGKSNLLFESDWGKVINDGHKLTKASDKNEYTIAVDLMDGDQFQFALNSDWHNKRGFGYMTNPADASGVAHFKASGGGIGNTSLKGTNIEVIKAGNYTLTLTTYPNEDTYNTSDPTYTEEGKEVYNVGTFDTITWVRNGDVEELPNITMDYYIKGESITNWKDFYNASTKMIKQGDTNIYKYEVYLIADEQFMFTSTMSQAGNVSTGAEYAKYAQLDDGSLALFTAVGENIKTKEAGTYTFTYNADTKALSATVDKTKMPQARDYYIDGTFAGEWGDTLYGAEGDRTQGPLGSNNFISTYKLVETSAGSGVFEIKGIELAEGKELMIQSYKAGSAEPGKWGQDGYNVLGGFNFTYLAANESFEAVSAINQNILVKVTGTYDIKIDSYSGIITITPVTV